MTEMKEWFSLTEQNRKDIYNQVIRGIDYANHARNKINFIPPKEIIKAWEKDYQTMRESMIYGKTKSFKALIERLEELRRRMVDA